MEDLNGSGYYSIKDLESLTGVKAHTIRIWEKRYNIIKPIRTETNIRAYTDGQLRHMLNISALNNHGIKISKLAAFSQEEIHDLLNEISSKGESNEALIAQFVDAMMRLDEVKFSNLFEQSVKLRGFEDTITGIIYPFLERIGTLWTTGNIIPGQEHFISNLIRQKLNVHIDQLPESKDDSNPTFLLFLPDSEWHEIGMLLMNYILRARSFNTIYLGASVRTIDLIEVFKLKKVDYLFTIVTVGNAKYNVGDYLKTVSEMADNKKIFISGYGTKNLDNLPENIQVLKDCDEAIDVVASL